MLRDAAILDSTLDAHERAALDRFVREARVRLGERLVRVILYGSRARGDAGEDSDIDVLLVLADAPDPEDRRWVFDATTRIALDGPGFIDIDPQLVSLSRLADLRARERRFSADVDAEGIDL